MKKGAKGESLQKPKIFRIFLFRVSQRDIYGGRGTPYRVLAVPESASLYSFGLEILASFDFDFNHPFGFYNNLNRYYNSTIAYELFADLPDMLGDLSEGILGVKKTRVKNVFTTVGQKMLFLFDYGSEWHFRVTLKGIEQGIDGKKYPCIVKSVGDSFPQYGEPDEDEDEDENMPWTDRNNAE